MNDFSQIPPVYAGIFTADKPPSLIGGQCTSCGAHHFPKPDICPDCLSEVRGADFGQSATIYSVTTVRTRAPLGLPSPYSVALVDLEDVPCRIFALMDPEQAGSFSIGQRVSLHVAPIGVNNEQKACLRPYFSADK
ncbi:hypothetical protein GCM10017044_05120 [Kordiimonas sediminis]|uniref:DNA-binding protein n=1 Tax=Kordiimonas sediminis TaxID=1735581 RepID=A0A919AMH6_9PROT|nr:zinc ribbon domain-containing protein [Kordiimonas sediminis]GHF14006.1 hypothetical protein GCM10017044_05120 [Kordiimonas sediminis]